MEYFMSIKTILTRLAAAAAITFTQLAAGTHALARELAQLLYALAHPRMLFASIWAQPPAVKLWLFAALCAPLVFL